MQYCYIYILTYDKAVCNKILHKFRAAEYAALKRFICDHALLSFEASLPAALRA